MLTREQIKIAIQDEEWQFFRVSLKGQDTLAKLRLLSVWLAVHRGPNSSVQVENYVNALKRGGQLVGSTDQIMFQLRDWLSVEYGTFVRG